MTTERASQLFPTAGDAYLYCQTHGLEISITNDNLWDIAEGLYNAENKIPEHKPHADQNTFEAKIIAARLADRLFELGNEPGRPTCRIQFMGGDLLSEYAQGGLDKPALTQWLHREIQIALDV